MAPIEDDDGKTTKGPQPGGSSKMILLIVGGVALLSCCCCTIIGGYFGYQFVNRPAFVGHVWQAQEPQALAPHIIIGFEANNTGLVIGLDDILAAALTKKELPKEANFKWKLIDEKTLEITMNDSTKKLWTDASSSKFDWVVSGDELTLTNKADSKSVKLKKADPKKK